MNTDADSGIANSFTDLMTSLAVIFILLLCAFMNNAFEESQNTRTKILASLQQQLEEYIKKGVRVESDPNDPLALLILIPEGLLEFKFDRYEIPEQGVDFLRSFIPKFTNIIYSKEFRNDISSVVVEGHTDSSGSDNHNLELSQRRSMAVVSKAINLLDEHTTNSDDGNEKKEYFLRVLSASGRGKQDPVMRNEEEDQSLSRRVIFKVRVRSFEEKKIEKILNNA